MSANNMSRSCESLNFDASDLIPENIAREQHMHCNSVSNVSASSSTLIPGRAVNSSQTTQALRQQLALLKSDLCIERARNKQMHKDKVAELKKVQEACDIERERAVDAARLERLNGMQRLRDTLQHDKDVELQQILLDRGQVLAHHPSSCSQPVSSNANDKADNFSVLEARSQRLVMNGACVDNDAAIARCASLDSQRNLHRTKMWVVNNGESNNYSSNSNLEVENIFPSSLMDEKKK